mgnify:FL=1|jgi:hypothetical protein
MKRFVYFFVCALMTVSMVAQSLSLSKDQLNSLVNGVFTYELPDGAGTLKLTSRNGAISFSKSELYINKGEMYFEILAPEGKRTRIKSVQVGGHSQGGFFSGSTVKYVNGGYEGKWHSSLYHEVANTGQISVWGDEPVVFSIITNGIRVDEIEVEYEPFVYITELLIEDKASFVAEESIYAEEIQLDRKLSAGWNTLCLPFDCNVSELGEGVVAQQFVAYDPNTGLDFAIVDQLEANKPYMVYCPTEIPAMTLTFTGREIYAATPQPVSFNGMTFIGNYEPGFSMYGKYGVAQNKLIKGGANATVNGTRAYFEYAEPETQAVFRINYQQESGTTGIENIQVAPQKKQGVYTLQGVCVRKDDSLKGLPAGVYIQNGKKVLVK